jgi:hypothetical protein
MGNGQAFRGYATAWLMAQTQNDSYAQGAFYGDCEICGHPNWTVQMKNMDGSSNGGGDGGGGSGSFVEVMNSNNTNSSLFLFLIPLMIWALDIGFKKIKKNIGLAKPSPGRID